MGAAESSRSAVCSGTASARGKVNTEAVVSGTERASPWNQPELEELVPAMSLRPLVLACWNFATGRDTLPAVSQWWDTERRRIEVASTDGAR